MGSADGQSRFRHSRAIVLATTVAAPMLFAPNLPPSPTLLNETLAIALWGFSLAMGASPTRAAGVSRRSHEIWPIGAAIVLSMVGTALATALGALPECIAMDTLSVLTAALAMTCFGRVAAHARPSAAFVGLFWGLVAAGALSALISCAQVFAPAWPDGDLIARSALPGRAVGNLRQPNHLSSLLLWAMIAAVGLKESGSTRRKPWLVLQLMLTFALALTGSRTGVLGMLLLAGWGSIDRRLSRETRVALVVSPLVFSLLWFGLSAWAHVTGHSFGGEGRFALAGGGDISSSRLAIWSNTLTMIAREPWIGVGFGEFNIAWTLTEFPDRPIAFFDHTHNLALQLLVELGIPLGSLVLVLLLVALVQAWRRAWACNGDEGVARRAAFMMVLMIGLHSMLEYPLWYAYFLLPTAFAWAFALSRPEPVEPAKPAAAAAETGLRHPRPGRALTLAGLAMTIGSAAAVLDYRSAVQIYDPPDHAAPLEERIAIGQRSPLFGQHADYAAATAFGEPKAPLSPSQQLAFKRAPHQLLDIRLMIAWSQALAAQGELDKARWLAARIREFRNPGADEYFAPCQHPDEAARAFQCQPPTRVVNWREFVQR